MNLEVHIKGNLKKILENALLSDTGKLKAEIATLVFENAVITHEGGTMRIDVSHCSFILEPKEPKKPAIEGVHLQC